MLRRVRLIGLSNRPGLIDKGRGVGEERSEKEKLAGWS
jgi:hypothetical protein